MTDTHEHLSRDTLDTVKDVMGDDFHLLISTFINDAGEHIERLRAALARQDSDAARATAHSFKGSCHNLGAVHLAWLCEHVEQRSLEGNLDGLSDYLSQIEQEFTQGQRLLNEMVRGDGYPSRLTLRTLNLLISVPSPPLFHLRRPCCQHRFRLDL